MAYKLRLALLIFLDSLIVSVAIYFAFLIVYPYTSQPFDTNVMIITAIALLAAHHVFALVYNLYNKVWAYASVGELVSIVKAVTLTIVTAGIVQFFVNDFSVYRRALIVTWMLHIILIGGSRFLWRIYRDRYITNSDSKKRTLIIGAGDAGAMMARQLNSEHNDSDLWPIGFVDDDGTKERMQVYNLPVLGKVKDVAAIVSENDIEHIVIAIPSLKNGQLNDIIEQCSKTNVKVQMIPKLEDLASGRVAVSNLKNVEVEDLLGRAPVVLDMDSIEATVTGHTVMVTGAGGSIGSELCRQLMRFKPARIILFGHGEFSIYSIDMELKKKYGQSGTEIIPIIGDVKDRKRVFKVIEKYQPKKIYHAAAHKHVPLMEYNPHESVKNNVIGTKNVAEAAHANQVDTFVLVSTDKAVNPTNVMGASKRVAEMVVQHLASQSETKFVAVRFGNVLGSRGSVIPLFKKQIEAGGPVTVTDPEMTRYFMTIPEASRLVVQAGTLARGGEIFVLDMGEPVKIVDLAKNLIRLSGYSEEEIGIEYSGIRPGEKMYEELLGEDEVHPEEVFEKIYIGKTVEVDMDIILDLIENFRSYEADELKKVMMEIVFMERELLGHSS